MAFAKTRKAAQAVQSTGRFCLNPLCLHVAGSAKCSKDCCKVGKGKKR